MPGYVGNHLPDVGGYTGAAAIDKYRVVSVTSGSTASEAGAGTSTHGQALLGIAVESTDSGDALGLVASGVFPAIVNGNSANIVAGDTLKSTTGGILIKAATTSDIANYEACEAATADGVVILVRRIKHTLVA
jgi:hypothetical protein